MKSLNRIIFMAILLMLVLFTNIIFVNAVGISVTKAVVDYRNVLKGGYAEDYVYVASDSEFDIPLDYEVIGDVKEWISFQPDLNFTRSNKTIFISKNQVQEIKFIVQPPADIPAGNYSGGVRLITGALNRPEAPYGSQLQAAFLIRINVEITGAEFLSCNAGGIKILDAEIGNPLEFSMTATNAGNIRIRPNVSIDIWNQDQTKLMSTVDFGFGNIEVLPTTSKVLFRQFDNTLRIGQYWAYVTVFPCQKTDLISFSVLEKGQIADQGELLRIENQPWAVTDEVVPITAFFRNNGERIVSAKFKGLIKLGEKIITTIDTDYYDVDPGSIQNITFYFTPKKVGQYYISGRVLYNNKLTFEKSSILNANQGEGTGISLTIYILIIIIIVIILMLLLILIKRRRKKDAK